MIQVLRDVALYRLVKLPTFRSIVVPSYLCTTCNINTKIQGQSSIAVASMAITAQKVHIRRHVPESCTAHTTIRNGWH